MKKAILWKKLKEDIIECQACNFRCKISPNNTGVCQARKNVGGELFSLTYGQITSRNIDPVEKKPLYHFYPGSVTYSIGTLGCNFKCLFCQNFDISQSTINENDHINDIRTPEEIVEEAKRYGCDSIAYTYNEPSIFIEFVIETAELAKKAGMKNIYVTNGYETKEALDLIKDKVDAMNIDLKSMSSDFYLKKCGAVDIEKVLETIKTAYSMGFWIEISTLVIPLHNDSEEELRQIAEFIAKLDKNIPWHILRFFPMYQMEDIEQTPIATLLKAYNIGKEAGLNYIYIGNLSDEGYENTKCTKCGEILVERKWRQGILVNKIKQKKCPKCGEEIAGIF